MKKLYKVLGPGGKPAHGGKGTWFLPRGNRPGKWMPVVKDPVLCERGYHGCTLGNLFRWIDEPRLEVYELEVRGTVKKGEDKLVASEARLVKKTAWNDRVARLLACDIAELVLPIWEAKYPEDKRPRVVIEVSRRFANGQATKEELAAARHAAYAAWSAADAARDAAYAALSVADADWYAAYAAWSTADAVGHAAYAAWSAADAAWAAAGSAMTRRINRLTAKALNGCYNAETK